MSDTTVHNPFDESDDIPSNESGPSFPFVSFMSGQPGRDTVRSLGAFFIGADEGLTPGKPFEKYALVPSDGGETINGFASHTMTVSVIRIRRAWFAEGNNGRRERFAWGDYELALRHGKVRGKAQVIAYVAELESPVVISLAGTHSADLFDRNGWFNMARRFAFDPIAKHYGESRKHSLYFRTVIGPGVDEKGKPVYHVVGSGNNVSSITRIVSRWPNAPVAVADFGRYINSRNVIEDCKSIYRDTERWANEWEVSPDTDNSEVPF